MKMRSIYDEMNKFRTKSDMLRSLAKDPSVSYEYANKLSVEQTKCFKKYMFYKALLKMGENNNGKEKSI